MYCSLQFGISRMINIAEVLLNIWTLWWI